MRKYQQRKILELTETLIEANHEIERLLNDPSSKKVLNELLSNCQEFAIQVCDYIDSIQGEGTRAVELLTDYCKLVYLLDSEPNNINLDAVIQQTVYIKNSVQEELKPDKIEVAFLPYKLSMADSLESIWQAALADPKCDTYIIPIPYYDCNSDRTLGQMHYEGDLYPKNIPITDWNTYNIKERHPDIIFFHYPYDNGNFVTRVSPNYYSKELKECTDLLVYVPYFISLHDMDESLAVNMGTIHADKVIVQSEKVRRAYITAFENATKNNENKAFLSKLENKFIALGSPKFDKVFNTKREDETLPEEWQSLIYRPDGSQKRIIFYNTSLTAILLGNEQYLKKLRSVIDLFRQCEDVVLWWRPHPLNEAAYASMRPHLLGEYQQILTEYKNEGFGILDDTPDLHRAIAWSDAYYGDGSSVMALFGAVGKIMMVQIIDTISVYSKSESLRNEIIYAITAYEAKRRDDIFLFEKSVNSLTMLINLINGTRVFPEVDIYLEKQKEIFQQVNEYEDKDIGSRIYDYCSRIVR